MTNINLEHILLLIIAAFILYYLMNSCSCKFMRSGNGFSVGAGIRFGDPCIHYGTVSWDTASNCDDFLRCHNNTNVCTYCENFGTSPCDSDGYFECNTIQDCITHGLGDSPSCINNKCFSAKHNAQNMLIEQMGSYEFLSDELVQQQFDIIYKTFGEEKIKRRFANVDIKNPDIQKTIVLDFILFTIQHAQDEVKIEELVAKLSQSEVLDIIDEDIQEHYFLLPKPEGAVGGGAAGGGAAGEDAMEMDI